MKLAFAQFDFAVGDIEANRQLASNCIANARDAGVCILVFAGLALTRNPPEDQLLRPGFMRQAHEALESLLAETRGIDVLVGHPCLENGRRYNSATWIRDGVSLARYDKHCLPNYAVFDERRYFEPGSDPLVVEKDGIRFGVMICEDAWDSGPGHLAREAGAEVLLVPNASPYRDDKLEAREDMLRQRHAELGLPLAYANLVGGQDELVFDGRSMLMDADGRISAIGPLCRDQLLIFDFDAQANGFRAHDWPEPPTEKAREIYQVLVRGLADYVRKNGFAEVVLGLSGGIDSALTLAIAADALGPDAVHTVMMPSQYTSKLSCELAQEQASMLGIDHRVIRIDAAQEALESALAPSFSGTRRDVTEENLQARLRGTLLMALSNKFDWLPLATSNKSELAVGYSTIYGDMCG
ncbi:MAG: NAD+ synthase, partial [Xanthomonadales bacterium]|nr:NAD+ synthase [Xanthomonadales bacterium]